MKLLIFNYFRNKRKVYPFFLMILSCLFVIIFLIYLTQYLNYINNVNIKNKLINRTFIVNYENKKLNNNKHIKYTYKMNTLPISFSDKINASLIYFPMDEIKIKYGNKCKQNNEILISLELAKKISINNPTSLINKEVSINIYDNTTTFKIVGIYDNSSVINSDYIYTLKETIKLNDNLKISTNFDNDNLYIVIIDDYINSNYIIDKFTSQKIDISLLSDLGKSEIDTYEYIIKFLKIMELGTIIAVFIILFIIINNILFDEKKDIALLKTVGYNKNSIIRILLLRVYCFFALALIIIIPIIILMFLLILIFKISNSLYAFLSYNYFDIIKPIISIIILSLLLPLFTTFIFHKKIKKISPIDLFKVE